MRITADTNVLVRSVVLDDERQSRAAAAALREAEIIAVALPSLCEFVWVLRRVYGFDRADIVSAVRRLLEIDNLAVNRPAAEAGLAVLEDGGDFADGVIAYEGSWLRGETFVSFDRRAVAVLEGQGRAVRLLDG